MTTLVHAALVFRRNVRTWYGFATAIACGLVVFLGAFRVSYDRIGFEHCVLAATWIAVFSARLNSRMERAKEERKLDWLDFELGLLLIVAFHAVLQIFGGLTSPFYPTLYALVAFLSSFSTQHTVLLIVFSVVGYDAALYFVTEGHTDITLFSLHVLFLIVFGLLSSVFTQIEIRRLRRQSECELTEEKKRVREDARLFRLVGAPTESVARDREKLFRSSVEQVHQSLFHNLELLKLTLGLHSCVLLLHDDKSSGRDKKLRIIELVTDSDDIFEGPFTSGEGAVGGAEQRGQIINLEHIRPGYRGICYYRSPAEVRAFMAIPIKEKGEICGVLCADRLEDRSFTPGEEQILQGSIEHILRTLENERVFVQLERSKREQTILHMASQALGAALDEEAVLDAGLRAVSEIVPYDFAAISQYDAVTHRHSVRRAIGSGAEAFQNLSFRDNTSLTAMAVKNLHYLPYRGEFDSNQQIVYTRKANLSGMGSLLILPLLVREEAIGTLALATKERNTFTDSVRPALQVLANQLAVALSNAASVARLEQMATIDALTGCYNKRAFNEELELKLRAAERFERKLSLVITDLDHFKSVNDTYGHAVGDVVLRELGQILIRVKRETDIVARFGGEEFCVLCEETDSRGAVQLAERVREELSNTVFQTELGKLHVTCSLGVATYPDVARDTVMLFEVADRALYVAKQNGRNRVCTVGG